MEIIVVSVSFIHFESRFLGCIIGKCILSLFKCVMSKIGYISPWPLSRFSCFFMDEITDFPTVVQVFFPLSAPSCARLPDLRAPERSSGYDAEGGSAHVGIRFVELVTLKEKGM